MLQNRREVESYLEEPYQTFMMILSCENTK